MARKPLILIDLTGKSFLITTNPRYLRKSADEVGDVARDQREALCTFVELVDRILLDLYFD